MERAVTCPQCGAPLTPHHFARSITCSFCGAVIQLDQAGVSAAKFHDAYHAWNSPETYSISSWVSLDDNHWALGNRIATGDVSDVYFAQRARWPSELAILKVLRNLQNAEMFENEWNVLQTLQTSPAQGAEIFTMLMPQPILHGIATGTALAGLHVNLYRWESGFHYNFDQVKQAYPTGIPPRASIWIWRRALEILSFIHASGMAHGAIVPAHLLPQENEHGIRLVGYGSAGRLGDKLKPLAQFELFYPKPAQAWSTLSTQLDLVMSARCLIAILGGNPTNASLPANVPAPLAQLLQRIALAKSPDSLNDTPWDVRQQLGKLADQVFGAPQFIPIVMPA